MTNEAPNTCFCLEFRFHTIIIPFTLIVRSKKKKVITEAERNPRMLELTREHKANGFPQI